MPIIAHTSLDPTTDLPVEILRAIFTELRESTLTCDWVRVSWVCSRWRKIALDQPMLWSRLGMTVNGGSDEPMIRDLLSRSRNLNLTLALDGSKNPNLKLGLTTIIVDHGRRLTTLSVTIKYAQLADLEVALQQCPLALTKLFVVATDSADMQWDAIRYEPRTLSLLASSVPSLRTLSMKGMVVTAPPSVLKALTTLTIEDTARYTAFDDIPPFQDYLPDVLNACTTLEHLSLYNICSADPERWMLKPISIPTLQTLTLEGTVTVRFLHHFRLPPTASLYIDNQWFEYVDINEGVLHFAIPLAIIHNALPTLRQTKTLIVEANHALALSGNLSDDEPDTTDWNVVTGFKASRKQRIATPILTRALRELHEVVDPKRLVHLELHLRIQREAWHCYPLAILLGRFANLRVLVVGDAAAARGLVEGECGMDWWIGAPLKSVTFCLPGPMKFLRRGLMKYSAAFKDPARRSLSIRLAEEYRQMYTEDGAKLRPVFQFGVHRVPVRWEWTTERCRCCQLAREWKKEMEDENVNPWL